MASGGGLLDKLGSYIPGYKGYAEKEARRDTDRVLRELIVKRLNDRKGVIDNVVAECARQMRFDNLETLELIKRRIEKLADLVRHAPQGYSGFFDRVQVTPDELNAVYALDLKVGEMAEALAGELGVFEGDKAGCNRVLAALRDIEETFRCRDHVLERVA